MLDPLYLQQKGHVSKIRYIITLTKRVDTEQYKKKFRVVKLLEKIEFTAPITTLCVHFRFRCVLQILLANIVGR